jgi:hypothetical protein
VLRTNTDLNPLEAMLCYKQLWTVEQTFRTAKHLFSTRPIFHKLDETIRGHVFCSFLALVLKTALEERIAALGRPGSGRKSSPIWIPWPRLRLATTANASSSAQHRGRPPASPCVLPVSPSRRPSATPRLPDTSPTKNVVPSRPGGVDCRGHSVT